MTTVGAIWEDGPHIAHDRTKHWAYEHELHITRQSDAEEVVHSARRLVAAIPRHAGRGDGRPDVLANGLPERDIVSNISAAVGAR
jgi:hypothetical protein